MLALCQTYTLINQTYNKMEGIQMTKNDQLIKLRLKAHDLLMLSLQAGYGVTKEIASIDAMTHIRGKTEKELKEIIEKYAV
jgi:hypothetical protein